MPLVKTTKGKGLVERFTKRQTNLAQQISNDIAEDIDNDWTRQQLIMAVAYYSDVSADAWRRSSDRESKSAKVLVAAALMDWPQVVFNGGPPCFHLTENGLFCGRAERWVGHGKAHHEFVSLVDMVLSLTSNQLK